MAASDDLLNFISLTEMINKVKSPNTFLKQMLFSDHRSYPTENFEVGIKIGGREMAPFIRKGGQAVMVGGYTNKMQMVAPANISLKRPFSPDVMFVRRPGFDQLYPTSAEMEAIGNSQLADDVQSMGDKIANAEEYLCAQALTGVIAYSSAEGEEFECDFNRSNSHDVSPTDEWDDQTDSRILDDIEAVKLLHSEDEGLPVTDAILGNLAAKALKNNTLVKSDLAFSQTKYNVGAGLDLTRQWTAEGALFLGELAGVRLWHYARQVILPSGSSVDLIGEKMVHFVSNVPAAEFRLCYGAIPEIVGNQPRLFVGERFSKSDIVVDPPQIVQYVRSRPLPVLRKPNATSSMQVLA
jgi:hypothetical protein